jgi:hypothetical protein
MLAAVRTILDESSASFWTDAEIYAALADGQNVIVEKLLNMYRQTGVMKFELTSILFDDTGTDDNVAVPAGFLELVRATYDHNGTGGQEQCEILTHDKVLEREDSSYTSATATEPIAYIKSTSDALKIYFLPTKDGTPAFTFWHITKPADIASGQNPALPVTTHSAIVHYATSRMLDKDQRPQESQIQYGLFLKEIEGL